jgi:hypothetical protein
MISSDDDSSDTNVDDAVIGCTDAAIDQQESSIFSSKSCQKRQLLHQ